MAQAIISRTVRETVGLREGGAVAGHEVLATYRSETNGDVFALSRDGLLLRQGDGWRYIHNEDVEDVDLPIMEVKASINGRRLIVVLSNGERVEVPVDGGHDPTLDIFPIYAWLRRRIHQHKVLSRKR